MRLKSAPCHSHEEQQPGLDHDYVQPGNLFGLLPPDEQQRLIASIVGSLKSVPVEIQHQMVEHFTRLDPAYGGGIARGLGL